MFEQTLRKTFLVLFCFISTKVITAAKSPKNDRNLNIFQKEDSLEKLMIAPNAALKTQDVLESGVFEAKGKKHKINKAKPISVFEDDASYIINGKKMKLPTPTAFRMDDGDDMIIFSKDVKGTVKAATVMNKASGSTEYFESVSNGVIAKIDEKNMDKESLKRFFYEHKETPGLNNNRKLSAVTNRKLQTSCSQYKVIDLALAFESSFCSQENGYNAATAEITNLVAIVSAKYQQTGLCTKVKISYLEGYCDENNDPYKAMVDLNQSGCGGPGLLDSFQSYWNNNKATVSRDSVHLISGTGLECDNDGCIIGCAYVGVLCSSFAGYGVNYVTFTGNTNLRAVLLAHELGHNAAANHFGVEDYIMYPLVNPATLGFSSQTINSFITHFNQVTCIDNETVPPTPSPTKTPTKNPTIAPTSSPTKTPTKSPTIAPTSSPTKMPSKSPTIAPTLSLTKTPSKTPTKAPSSSPTGKPTKNPTVGTAAPTKSIAPTSSPSKTPTKSPSKSPTSSPSEPPTKSPTKIPTTSPTEKPTKNPTAGTPTPTQSPTKVTTQSPTTNPTPSATTSLIPSLSSTSHPTKKHTTSPTKVTQSPTSSPSFSPSAGNTNTCGDGICSFPFENKVSCPSDCAGSVPNFRCGDGICNVGDGEDCISCPKDCNRKLTGNKRYCCGDDTPCSDRRCRRRGKVCISRSLGYEDWECGDGVCTGKAEDNVTCKNDCTTAGCCGDGICNVDEDCKTCPQDCRGRKKNNGKYRFCCGGKTSCSDKRCRKGGFQCTGDASCTVASLAAVATNPNDTDDSTDFAARPCSILRTAAEKLFPFL